MVIDELQKILDENHFWSYLCFISLYLPTRAYKGRENFIPDNRYILSGQLDFVNTVMNLLCAISVH